MDKPLKNASIELLVYTILFAACMLFMPWAYFYYEGEGEEFMITEPQRFYDSILIVLFPVVFAALLCAFYSGSKALLITLVSLIGLFLMIAFLFIMVGFGWWGVSPFHPDLAYGFGVSQLIFFVVIVRVLIMREKLDMNSINSKVRLICAILAIAIPALIILTLVVLPEFL